MFWNTGGQSFWYLNSKSKFGRDYNAALESSNQPRRFQFWHSFICHLLKVSPCISQEHLLLGLQLQQLQHWTRPVIFHFHLMKMFSIFVTRWKGCQHGLARFVDCLVPTTTMFCNLDQPRPVCKLVAVASKAANVLDCESTSGVYKLKLLWQKSFQWRG